MCSVGKLATWLSRINDIQRFGPVDPVLMFRGLVSAHLRTEYEFSSFVNNLDYFQNI